MRPAHLQLAATAHLQPACLGRPPVTFFMLAKPSCLMLPVPLCHSSVPSSCPLQKGLSTSDHTGWSDHFLGLEGVHVAKGADTVLNKWGK